MAKDWTGTNSTAFRTLGASNHAEHDREEHDFYATDPNSLVTLLDRLKVDNVSLQTFVWEPACGMGHLSEVLKRYGHSVLSSDLIDRGYGDGTLDFLAYYGQWHGDIVTNPPYKFADQFLNKSMEVIDDGNKCIMFLKIQFLEGQKRKELFELYPPKYIYVHSKRQTCYIDGDMSEKKGSAVCYCWYVWEKGFTGEPIIRWI